jgi:hypothetical protein
VAAPRPGPPRRKITNYNWSISSDAGSQYTALAFTEELRAAGIAGSIAVGDRETWCSSV